MSTPSVSGHRTRLAIAAVVAGLVLAGCTKDDGQVALPASTQPATTSQVAPSSAVPSSAPASSAAPASSSSPTTATSTQPTVAEPTTTAPNSSGGLTADPTTGPRTKKVGATTTYVDQAAVTVGDAQPWTSPAGTRAVKVTLTFHNRGQAAIPLEFWYVEGIAGGATVEPIDGPGLSSPAGELAPGQTRTITMAFPREQGQKFQLRVTWRDGFPFTYDL